MNVPSFTAEAALYRSGKTYSATARHAAATTAVVPQFGPCSFVAAACVAALLDPAVGDEIPICGAYWYYCGGEM